jgi:2-polyprenyl-3-methyl-5-hydroxy-6-metoxy-1,4-benzoquinol methylase
MNDIYSPLVHNTVATLKEVIVSSKIKELYLKTYGIEVNFEVENIYKYECQKSGYGFFYPFDLGGDSSFYEQLQRIDWYYMPWKWEHQKATDYVRKGNNVLEVGSGNSSFIEHLSKKGVQATGLELNELAVQLAQDKGLNVLRESIETHSQNYPTQYDLVCSFQVLEHISDVHSFIDGMIKCLKPGGILIVCVPNNDSFIKKAEWNILNMPPHHMGLWNKKSLSYLPEIFPLEKARLLFEPLQTYHYNYYQSIEEKRIFSIPIIRSVYYRLSLNKVASKLVYWLSKYINGHSIMAVYSKAK